MRAYIHRTWGNRCWRTVTAWPATSVMAAKDWVSPVVGETPEAERWRMTGSIEPIAQRYGMRLKWEVCREAMEAKVAAQPNGCWRS